ncbi:MAG: hypothetical protein IT308_10400 [Anaerolineaceae bacterium]|nr:hypothetical protein [Anaerolineaceae bacterium]
MTNQNEHPKQELENIILSAKRLGVELDEADALQWLAAMSTSPTGEVAVDQKSGVFGHYITMLDFSAEDLAHFRNIGRIVEFADVPGQVETALALSGSAAQSKIQSYPGDADFFERVNILADTREQACRILGKIMREKALSTMQGDTYALIEVKFGSYPESILHDDKLEKAGSPISWTTAEVKAGKIQGLSQDGKPVEISWEQAAQNPGWCKLDWVVADPVRKQLVNASNMLDATWEAADGGITPLDGYLDSFFQEVYLDVESIPIFSKLVKHVSGDALDHYVHQLENEIKKYLVKDPNYGKVAKRLYNIFRLNGRYVEAAYLRELFDEPTTLLYQVWSLIRTVEDSFKPGIKIDDRTILNQVDELILSVVDTLEGEKEKEIVRLLIRFKDILTEDTERGELSPQAAAARSELINIVNNFFYEKLTEVPEIQEYIEKIKKMS